MSNQRLVFECVELKVFGTYVCTVTEQTKTGDEFGEDGTGIFDHNDVRIISEEYPDCYPTDELLNVYARGSDESRDNRLFCVPGKWFNKFREAVEKFNKRLSKPKDKSTGKLIRVG